MEFEKLKCISNDINIDDYLKLYDIVRNNMENKEWLGTFEKDEIIEILNNGGKIWLYYDSDNIVSSLFFIPTTNNTLIKYNINYSSDLVASLGPVMVNPKYVGNGFQTKMMDVFESYVKDIGYKYIFTKAHSDNTYSISNILKNNYKLIGSYRNVRGLNNIYLKELV